MSAGDVFGLNQEALAHCIGNVLRAITHRQRLNTLNAAELARRNERDVRRREVHNLGGYEVRLVGAGGIGSTYVCVGVANANLVNTDKTADSLLLGRGLEGSEDCSMLDKKTRDLLKADLYVWICMGASKVDSVSDSDNGWSHKGGGYTLSEADKRRMLDWANDIYDEYDEPLVGKKNAIVMISNGIRRAHETFCGDPLPRIQKGR